MPSTGAAVHTRTDPSIRCFGFIIESFLWSVIYFAISSALPIPPYLEFIGAWPIFIAYKTMMVWHTGSHIGHMVVGAQIVDYRTGNPVSFHQALFRTVPEILYAFLLPTAVNAAMIFFTKNHRHVFDQLAGTISVVRVDPRPDIEYVDAEPPQPAPPDDDDPILYRESDRPRY